MKAKINETVLIANRKIIGEKILEMRKARGLTQLECAKLVGVNRTRISQIENGSWNLGIDTITLFAVYLGFTIQFKKNESVW
jgi:transcriptional regulator with XRE-family HTH domain